MAATAAIDAYVQMADKDMAQRAATLPAKWKLIPGIADAGFDPGSETFWATFDDGVPFMYFAGREIPASAPLGGESRAADELPATKSIALIDSLGTAYTHYEEPIRLAANKHGYAATVSRGFVEDLAVISGVAAIHWNTHSGFGLQRLPGAPPTKVFGIWTDSVAKGAPTAQISAMIINGEIGLAGAGVDRLDPPVDSNHNGVIEDDEKVTHEPHYMILPKFVTNHISLGANAFVWLDSCSSSTDPAVVAAFLAKKADVFVGWDNTVSNTEKATLPAFDRLLGENAAIPKDTPPYRPENFFDVIGWLQRQGLDKVVGSDGKIATLKYFTASPDNFGLMRPTIEYCNVFEPVSSGEKAKVLITGEFGSAKNYPRTVTVDETPVKILTWSSKAIECELPDSGAGSYGLVVVEANGHKSNEVPITLWIVKMTYLMDGAGSLFYRWDMDVKFRQDVHKARHKPWEIAKGGLKRWAPMWDSTATVTVGGQGPFSGGDGTWFGGGDAPYGAVSPPAAYFFAIPTTMDTETKKANNFVFLGFSKFTAHIVYPEGPVDEVGTAAPATNPFTMELDSDYSIKGHTETFPTAIGTGKLSWITTGGVWTPDGQTQARPIRK